MLICNAEGIFKKLSHLYVLDHGLVLFADKSTQILLHNIQLAPVLPLISLVFCRFTRYNVCLKFLKSTMVQSLDLPTRRSLPMVFPKSHRLSNGKGY